MNRIFTILLRWLIRAVAACVIVLALLIGLARLLLPQVPAYRAEIQSWVREATGYNLEFGHISAGLSLYGPELRFSDATISWPQDGLTVIRAEQIDISVNIWLFFTDRYLAPGLIGIRGARVELERKLNGDLYLQGRPWESFVTFRRNEPLDLSRLPQIELRVRDVEFSYQDLIGGAVPANCWIDNIEAVYSSGRVSVEGTVRPDAEFGRQLELSAEGWPVELIDGVGIGDESPQWKLYLAADDINLDHWFTLWSDPDLPLQSARGSANVWIGFHGWQPHNVSTNLDLDDLVLRQPNDRTALIERLAGRFEWEKTGDGWIVGASGLELVQGDSIWPESELSVRYSAATATRQLSADIGFVRLEDLMPFVQAIFAEEVLELLPDGAFQGDVEELALKLNLPAGQAPQFDISASFADLGYTDAEPGSELHGISGSVVADQNGGQVQIDSFDVRFGLFGVFRETVDVEMISGPIMWRSGADDHTILGNGIQVETAVGFAKLTFELMLPRNSGSPIIDLTATASVLDVSRVKPYLPGKIPAPVLAWLDQALVGGQVRQADIILRGPLLEFPYDHGEGIFHVTMPVRDGILDYGPGWPRASNLSGTVIFDGVSLEGRDLKGRVLGISDLSGTAQIEDLTAGVIEIDIDGATDADDALAFIRASPISQFMGERIHDVSAQGKLVGDVSIVLPVRQFADYDVNGSFRISDGVLGLDGIDDQLTDLAGTARLHNAQVWAEKIEGRLLDEPVQIQVNPLNIDAGNYSHAAWLTGSTPVAKATSTLHLPFSSYADGTIAWRGAALFPKRNEDAPTPFRIVVRSDLQGMSSTLPMPFGKAADDAEQVQIVIEFPQPGGIEVSGRLERDITWALALIRDEDSWMIERGAVHAGAAASSLPTEPGVELTGDLESLRPAEWLNLRDEPGVRRGRWQDIYRELVFHIDSLYVFGQRFDDVEVQGVHVEDGWNIEVESQWAVGSVFVPFDFGGDIPIILNMEQLLLVEPDTGDDSGLADPRTLPSIQANIDEFGIGDLQLGTLEARVSSVSQGLQTELLQTVNTSFTVDGSGEWLIIEDTPRTRIQLTLNSSDVQETLAQLGYEPLMEGESASVYADLSWEGSPGMAIIHGSKGEVRLTVKNGQLFDVEPGGGRMLGLMSVTALPRRLQLDFSDVFDKGLGFKRVKGQFRIDNGDAYTCNLGLDGPVADIGVVGRTGLTERDYEQVAVVRPHMSNMVPLGAAVIVSPGIGAALLLINRIFRDSLSSIGESYYRLNGSWDEPIVEQVQRADMDLTPFQDCEKMMPEIAPDPSELTVELPEEEEPAVSNQ